MNKKFFFVFRIVISIAILFALLKFIPYKKIVEIYRDSKKIYLFFGFFIFFCCNLVAVWRWRFLLSSLGKKISVKESLYACFSGLFFNLFFPSYVAGDVFRGGSVSFRHGEVKKVASSVLMDRFSGAIALVVICSVSFILGRNLVPQKKVLIPLLVLWTASGFGFLTIFSKRFFSLLIMILKESSPLRKKLIEFHDHLYFFKQKPSVFLKSMAYSLVIQLLCVLSFFAVSRGFNLNLELIYFLILVPIIMTVVFIPISIAGFGTREAAAVYFFSLVGIDKAAGASMSFLNGIFLVLLGILGGILYVSVYHRWLQSHS